MKTLIIAEAGVNHNGDINLAKQLIVAAAEAGADVVKFQSFKAENLALENAPMAEYQERNSGRQTSQYEMLKALEISPADHEVLIEHCRTAGIEFFSTAFDIESVQLLSKLKLSRWKIPSGEITNLPYLKSIAREKKPVLLSTGMATLSDIEAAIEVFEENGLNRDQITVLHCTTEYPAPFPSVNLRAMLSIREAFKVSVGYSDHTLGIEIPIAAVALGATVIEKHFTLDQNLPGPDHRASLEPSEFKSMISAIRNIESALGDGIKKPGIEELKIRSVARKSIVAAVDIKCGDVFSEKNLTCKRPGTGISPMHWQKLIGTKATRDYAPNELIEL